MSNVLELRDVCKTYTDFALNSVTFTLPTGHIMGFVGQNGAGKTTTIRLILNMAKRESGEIKVFGLDNITDEPAIKQEIGAVFDDLCLVDMWRVHEVEKALKGFYSHWDSAQFAAYLKQFKLPPHKKVKELSRGMKMKLMLAVAMSHGAKLLILDEPTSGLDPVARDELLGILRGYISDGAKSVFFSTHITSDLEKIADYITLIVDGKVFFTGTTENLVEHFLIIKGGLTDLTDEIKARIIGLSQTSTSFEGLLPAAQAGLLSSQLETKPPTIEEILIYISKGGNEDE
jgi:ABC-2 type transport system ATP-binding protein